MSVTLDRPATTQRRARSARPAGLAIALTPVGIAAAIGLMLGPFHFLGEEEVSLWRAFYSIAPTVLVLFLAPAIGLGFGLRSALSGNRAGVAATAVATVIIVALVVVALVGGWFDTTPAVSGG